MVRRLLLVIAALATAVSAPRAQNASHGCPHYAADLAATHYSPLADINRGNVSKLTVAWRWKPQEGPIKEYGVQPGNFQNTPLMIDNVLYVSTPYNRVVALDARGGRELWRYDPEPYKDGQPPNGTGFVHRGVAAWPAPGWGSAADGANRRIFMNSRY